MLKHLAIVSNTKRVRLRDVARVSAALQKQAVRDLAPIWGVEATVDPFASLEDVPLGYWPIILVDEVKQGAGVHLDDDGQPYALVEAVGNGLGWSLTASHEMFEMLVDPFGNRLVAGFSPKPGQGRVEFLVEVADPSEDDSFGYTSNGILVSDFYTPQYFDPRPSHGVRYSFTGAITTPREVLRGGYLSWHEPVSDDWWQLIYFEQPTFRNLGPLTLKGQSLRAMIDAFTPWTKRLSRLEGTRGSVQESRQSVALINASATGRAKRIQAAIKAMETSRAPVRRPKAMEAAVMGAPGSTHTVLVQSGNGIFPQGRGFAASNGGISPQASGGGITPMGSGGGIHPQASGGGIHPQGSGGGIHPQGWPPPPPPKPRSRGKKGGATGGRKRRRRP